MGQYYNYCRLLEDTSTYIFLLQKELIDYYKDSLESYKESKKNGTVEDIQYALAYLLIDANYFETLNSFYSIITLFKNNRLSFVQVEQLLRPVTEKVATLKILSDNCNNEELLLDYADHFKFSVDNGDLKQSVKLDRIKRKWRNEIDPNDSRGKLLDFAEFGWVEKVKGCSGNHSVDEILNLAGMHNEIDERKRLNLSVHGHSTILQLTPQEIKNKQIETMKKTMDLFDELLSSYKIMYSDNNPKLQEIDSKYKEKKDIINLSIKR